MRFKKSEHPHQNIISEINHCENNCGDKNRNQSINGKNKIEQIGISHKSAQSRLHV